LASLTCVLGIKLRVLFHKLGYAILVSWPCDFGMNFTKKQQGHNLYIDFRSVLSHGLECRSAVFAPVGIDLGDKFLAQLVA